MANRDNAPVSGGSTTTDVGTDDVEGLQRKVSWAGAVWIASGVPALVLFSLADIASTVGAISWMVWTMSVVFGMVQSATYAEIAGLYPNKSGGTSVYGAMAWLPYSRILAPISVWCNWLAWTPVLSIGSALAAGFTLDSLVPDDSAIHDWDITLLDLSALQDGLTVRIDAVFLIAVVFLLATFAIQHHGVLRAARVQMVIGIAVLVPLLAVALIPILGGKIHTGNLTPFEPVSGAWDLEGFQLLAGGLFLAAWSAYAFETSICYTREFKNPARDTPRAIFAAGGMCVAIYFLVPFAFQGSLGANTLTEGAATLGNQMGTMVGGGDIVFALLIVMLVLAVLLSITTAMAGSSRTLYQASVDGWIPKYLSKTNRHGAPTRAMWTDLCFNLCLLLLSDYIFVLAASSVCYMVFNFLNLNAGWIHRMDRPKAVRPWRAPTVLIGIGGVMAFVNAFFLGFGSYVWGSNAIWLGLVGALAVLPFFAYRHYVRDQGKFPDTLLGQAADHVSVASKRAGVLPYVALAGGIAVVIIGQLMAHAVVG